MSERAAARLALLAAAAAAAIGLVTARAPAVVECAEADTCFSVERVLEDVRRLAIEPRPIGSASHERARDFLSRQLAALAMDVQVQERTVAVDVGGGSIVAARVRNILARADAGVGASGQRRPGAVALVAHYDSRPNTPGAADNAAGVATVLEVLRVLRSASARKRDVVAIFTDAEEVGLLGARAFVTRHPWLEDVDWLINLEARGSTGPSVMFETTGGGLGAARAYAAAAPYPLATSVSQLVYGRMPNDTDFSLFRGRSLVGFNFAFIGDHASYHTMLDSSDRLDPRSVGHQGRNVAALAVYLAGSEETSLGDAEAVYFSIPRWTMVVYSLSVARALALAALLLAGFALWRFRDDEWTVRGLTRGALLSALSGAGSLFVGGVLWELVAILPAGVLRGPHGRPHETVWFTAAASLLVVVVVVVLSRSLSAGARGLAVLAGSLLFWTLASFALAMAAPGASYLLTWPAIVGWVAWWLGARFGKRNPMTVLLVSGAAAVAAILLIAPLVVLVVDALTISGLAVATALSGFALSLLGGPLAVGAGSSRTVRILSGTALLLVAFGLGRTWESGARPHASSMIYFAGESGAWWYTTDYRSERVPQGEGALFPDVGDLSGRDARRIAAPELALERSAIELVPATEDGMYSRTVEITPGFGGQVLRVRVLAPEVDAVIVDGNRIPVERSASVVRLALFGSGRAWSVGFEWGDDHPPSGRLEIDVLEQRFGLPKGVPPGWRGPSLIAGGSWATDSMFVASRASFEL